MVTLTFENETNGYWSIIKDASIDVKLALIKRLSESLLPLMTKEKRKKLDANDYAGIWSDDEYMDADEMVKVIREGRHVQTSRDNLF